MPKTNKDKWINLQAMWIEHESIERRYTEHRELLRDISCMSPVGDCTSEIDYYINKIKDNCKYE